MLSLIMCAHSGEEDWRLGSWDRDATKLVCGGDVCLELTGS